MIARRRVLLLPPLLGIAACAGDGPAPMLRRPEGYGWLTPLALNVSAIEVVEPAPGPAFRVVPPAPLVPAAEVARMGRDRLSAVGTAGTARFTVLSASLGRESLGSGLFAASSERLSCVLRCRVEILDVDGRRMAFAEAEARQTATRPEGASLAARNATEVVGRAMDDLNVEFEVQVRRALRDWVAGSAPAAGVTGAAPAGPAPNSLAPTGPVPDDAATPRPGGALPAPVPREPFGAVPDGILREDLPRG